MRFFMPNTNELTGGNSSHRSVDAVPSGMDTDPNADEEVIDQQDGSSPQEQYPEPIHPDHAKLAPNDLADSIAYALDGSGPGPTNAKPNVSGHDVITEGTSGAGPEEEERIFGK